MFWFVFISIILFILFLIVILVSSRSSNDKTLKRLKEELEAKNKGFEKQKTPEKIKPEQAEPLQQREERKVKEAVAATAAIEELAAVEETGIHKPEIETLEVKEIVDVEEPIETETQSIASLEEPFMQVEESSVMEEAKEALQEEAAADITEELTEENNEVVSAEVPFIEELAEAEISVIKAPSAPLEEPFIKEEDAFQPTTEEFIEEVEEEVAAEPSVEEVSTEVEAEEAAIQEELVSEEPELILEEVAEEDSYNYPPFDNTRAMEEFGLPKEDADEFIVDLIQQIEDEMPALEVAVQVQDSKKIEDISHMIKGSATNLGTGGAADVLIDFNTYMKTGNDPLVIASHMRNLHRSLAELKEQFQ